MTQEEAIEIVGEHLRSKGLPIRRYDAGWIVGDETATTIDAYVAVPFDFSSFSRENDNWATSMGLVFTRLMTVSFPRLLIVKCNWNFIICGEGWQQKDAEMALNFARTHFNEDTKTTLLLDAVR